MILKWIYKNKYFNCNSISRASKEPFVQHKNSTVSIKNVIIEISNPIVSNHRLLFDEMAPSALISNIKPLKMQATSKYLKMSILK